jgi:arginine decarboxylase
MLATTLGKKFDTDQIWSEEKNVYQISKDIFVRTRNITQNAVGQKGLWTTAFAAAVCLI